MVVFNLYLAINFFFVCNCMVLWETGLLARSIVNKMWVTKDKNEEQAVWNETRVGF